MPQLPQRGEKGPTMIHPSKKSEVERLRGGIALAAGRSDRVTLEQVAIFDALLVLPEQIGTMEDATADDVIRSVFADGGKPNKQEFKRSHPDEGYDDVGQLGDQPTKYLASISVNLNLFEP